MVDHDVGSSIRLRSERVGEVAMKEDRPVEFSGTTQSYRGTFLSYVHEDVPLARPLARLLRDEGVPVWYDEWQLHEDLRGEALYRALRVAVARADAMVILDTENHRGRSAQKVPGATLAHSMAPPEVPLNDAPILAAESSYWWRYRSLARMEFKWVWVEVAAGREARVSRRRGILTEQGRSYGVETRLRIPADWGEFTSRVAPSATLIGEQVEVTAPNPASAVPLLLRELRMNPGLWAQHRESYDRVISDVREAQEYSPTGRDLMGFSKPAAEIRAESERSWSDLRRGDRNSRRPRFTDRIRAWWNGS